MKKNLLVYIFILISLSVATTFAQTETASITPINLNTASDEEILSVPGTGNRMLREFKEYRPYSSIAQFRRELGKYVDEAQVTEWEKYVFVPTNPNTATEDDLLALPGLDEAAVQLIIAKRSYADWNALSSVLSQSYDEATLTALEPYWIFE
jgi:DNA uptake protein ComE-like DNA-binding protein